MKPSPDTASPLEEPRPMHQCPAKVPGQPNEQRPDEHQGAHPPAPHSAALVPFTQDGRARVQEVLHTIGLERQANRPAGVLAHGEKQWLELGMLMAQDPELLLIDEPVAGMTPRESERTGELLLEMARKHTLLVIDHDMNFVRQIASKVTVLHEGQILCQGTVQEVQRDPKVIEVYLGQDREADAKDRTAIRVVR